VPIADLLASGEEAGSCSYDCRNLEGSLEDMALSGRRLRVSCDTSQRGGSLSVGAAFAHGAGADPATVRRQALEFSQSRDRSLGVPQSGMTRDRSAYRQFAVYPFLARAMGRQSAGFALPLEG
jgi:hypothetical protein